MYHNTLVRSNIVIVSKHEIVVEKLCNVAELNYWTKLANAIMNCDLEGKNKTKTQKT